MSSVRWEMKDGELKPFMDNQEVTWAAQSGSQEAFLNCPVYEALLEGPRGGGKTDTLLMSFAQHTGRGFGADWRGVLFRQTYPQLADVIAKTKKWFPQVFPRAKYNESASQWAFPGGEMLLLRHMAVPSDYWAFHGWSIPWLGWEELTTWPDPKCFQMIMSCSRSARKDIPLMVRSTTNPFGCVPHGEVLTDKGWVDIKNVQVGDRVVSTDAAGNAKNMPVSHVLSREYDGEMIERSGAGIRMEFTADHRLPLMNMSHTQHELRHFTDLPGQAIIRRSSVSWSGEERSEICGFDAADFMEFAGWFLSEGCVVRNKKNTQGIRTVGALQISQIKKEGRAEIEKLLLRMKVKFRKDWQCFVVSDRRLNDYFGSQGGSGEKCVPRDLLGLSDRLLSSLLKTLMMGDGSRREHNTGIYYTTSIFLRDAVCEIGTKLGYTVYTHTVDKPAPRKRSYGISLSSKNTVQLNTGNHIYSVKTTSSQVNVTRTHFRGMVYCLKVPGTETFFIRQNGCVWLSGNCGHNWVKARYKLPVPPRHIIGPIIEEINPEGKKLPPRVAIHSELSENKVLLAADPHYVDKIRAAAPNPAAARAWIYGDWDIVAGGMFDDVWSPLHHVVPDIRADMIPHTWRIDRSYDHGQSRPFSVGWWAQSSGEPIRVGRHILGGVRGDVFRLSEWYGWNGQPNEGQRLTAVEIAQGIIERELERRYRGRVKPGPADTSIYDDYEPGKSVAGDMAKLGVHWTRADKTAGSRRQGWQQMRQYLKDAIKPVDQQTRDRPGLFICQGCEHFLRTVPVLPRDEKDMDDVDSDTEDHVADEARYRLRAKSSEAKSRSWR